MNELLRIARIHHIDIEAVSLDFKIGNRRLSIDGGSEWLTAYAAIGATQGVPMAFTDENAYQWFRWLAGVGDMPSC